MRLGSPYDSFEDPYCYPGTSTLKNKLDLRDYAELEAFEHESVSAKGEEELPSGHFNPAHYCAIHRHLFGEVYNWAGQYRNVRTAKGGDMFCYPEHIAEQMELLFTSLNYGAFFAGRGKIGLRDGIYEVFKRTQRDPPFPRRQWPHPVEFPLPARRTIRAYAGYDAGAGRADVGSDDCKF